MSVLSLCTMAALSIRPAVALTEANPPSAIADPAMSAGETVPAMVAPLFGAPAESPDAIGPLPEADLISAAESGPPAATKFPVGALTPQFGIPVADADLVMPPAEAGTPPAANAGLPAPSRGPAIAPLRFAASMKQAAPAIAQPDAKAPQTRDAALYDAQSSVGTSSARLPSPMFGAAAEEVGDDVLAEQRGGFAFNGVNVALGAQIETYIDGQLSLVTTVNWTDTGATTSQTVSGLLTPASAADLQTGLLSTGHITMNVGNASVYLANGGQTAVIHNTDSGIQSILVNTASNTNIRTEVTASIDLSGYAAFKSGIQTGALAASLGQAIGAATLGALTN